MSIFLPWHAPSGPSLSESCLNVLIQGASHPLAIGRCMLCSYLMEASVSAVLFAGHHRIANVTFSNKGSKPARCEEQRCTQLLQNCSCYHNPVWMQHSPFTTLILTLPGARSHSHCWKGTCAALLHTRVQDNRSMDNIHDALIFLPLTGLFHLMAAAEVGTDIWSVAVLSVSSPIWIRNQCREPCSVICL